MNKINLFILGMQRAGSTSLFNFLSTHDKISFTLVKETNIFSDKRFFKFNNNKHSSFSINHSNLHKFIFKKKNSKYLLEGSVNHFYSLDAPQKIFNYNKNSYFIILYRDPIDRMYSHFLMDKMNYKHEYKFENAIQKELFNKKIVGSDLGYLEMSSFKKYIENWFQYFDKSRFLILDYNSINNSKYLNCKLSNFLNIEITGKLLHKNKSFELKKNMFTKPIKVFKLMRLKNFIPYFIILFLQKYLYQEPNSHNLDNFFLKKLNSFFSDDQNYLNNFKFL